MIAGMKQSRVISFLEIQHHAEYASRRGGAVLLFRDIDETLTKYLRKKVLLGAI